MPKKPRGKRASFLTHGHKHLKGEVKRIHALGKAHSKVHANKG